MSKLPDYKVTNLLIKQAYTIACEHGFHDEELPAEHFLMLAVTEVSEMVEADRKNRHAIRTAVEYCDNHADEIDTTSWATYFERDVKDTVEDELADACIRLFDLAGLLGLEFEALLIVSEPRRGIFENRVRCKSFTHIAYQVCQILTDNREPHLVIKEALNCLFAWGEYMHIDLLWHITHKMKYNASRPIKHGKKY